MERVLEECILDRKSYIVSQQFIRFFIPTIFMTMALSMSIVIDGMIVGNILGPEALAAVNLVLPVTLIFNSLYVLFGVGGSALMESGRLFRQGNLVRFPFFF